jgi:hypothetical protein
VNPKPETTNGHVPFGPNRPRCKVVGRDANVFSIIGAARRALRAAGQHEAASEFVQRAFQCKSYDHVLALLVEYVESY